MEKLKVIAIGNSSGAIFPKEMLAKLRLEKGDSFFVTECRDGYRITTADPDFERQMKLAEQIMREDRDVLRELAK